MDLTTLSDTELADLAQQVTSEQDRRQILHDLPLTVASLAATYRVAMGLADGTAWRQPTGAHDAVPPGESRVFEGHLWENTSGRPLAHSPSEYPDGWTDRGAAEPHVPDPTEHEPFRVGEAVIKGDIRVYNGILYECVQPHTTQADWSPDETPALWKRI